MEELVYWSLVISGTPFALTVVATALERLAPRKP
jgi:hypothetical protein